MSPSKGDNHFLSAITWASVGNMVVFIGVLLVVLLLGVIGFLNISVNTLIRDKPINETIDRATRPFLGASMILIGILLFVIFWAVMARIGY